MEEYVFENMKDREGKIIQCARCQNELCTICLEKWFKQCSSRDNTENSSMNTKCPFCNFNLIEMDDNNNQNITETEYQYMEDMIYRRANISRSNLVREIVLQHRNGSEVTVPIHYVQNVFQ